MFEHSRLRVGTVQQCHVGQLDTLPVQCANFIEDVASLVGIGRRFVEPQWFAFAFGGPEVLAKARVVVANQRVGGIENIAM